MGRGIVVGKAGHELLAMESPYVRHAGVGHHARAPLRRRVEVHAHLCVCASERARTCVQVCATVLVR